MVGPALKKLAPKLHIFIPAMTRTALDEAGRALGDALVIAGLCDEIEYENREGKGGALPALGVSSRRSSYGIKSVREQGMDVDMTNWRAVFTGQQVTPSRQAEMVEAIRLATADSAWKKSLKEGFWEPSWLAGADLRNFLDIDTKTAQLMVQLLKLKG